MREVVFSIPVTGTISLEGNLLRITVNETTITTRLEVTELLGKRLVLQHGKTLFDLVLDVARDLVQETGTNEFTGAELYHMALQKYPDLNLRRNSWGAHMIACAANHPSYGHYTSRRKYFRYLGHGRYSLDKTLILAGEPK